MPEYEIEWHKKVSGEDDRIIRTRQRGSTPEKAVENALAIPGGVQAYEVEGWDEPAVRALDEDGGYVDSVAAD